MDLLGATVTVTDNASPPNVIGSGQTSGSPSKFCVDLPTAGTYHVTSHIPGTTDQTATVNAVCNTDNNVTLTYAANSVGRICITITTCALAGPVAGAGGGITVTSTGGTLLGTATADGSGQACLSIAPGNYFYTVSYGGATKAQASIAVTACNTTTGNATFVTAYHAQVRVDNTTNNLGCVGTFNYYRGSGPSRVLLGTTAITISSVPSSFLVSAVFSVSFPAMPALTAVSYEIIFPNYTFTGGDTPGCMNPSAPFIFDQRSAGPPIRFNMCGTPPIE